MNIYLNKKIVGNYTYFAEDGLNGFEFNKPVTFKMPECNADVIDENEGKITFYFYGDEDAKIFAKQLHKLGVIVGTSIRKKIVENEELYF